MQVVQVVKIEIHRRTTNLQSLAVVAVAKSTRPSDKADWEQKTN
jgi:hypothetical protein